MTAAPASATWSIVIADTRTGEIAIGSATCVAGYDLRNLLPIVVVGRGVGAAQSYVDFSARNRMLISTELKKGTPLPRLLALLAQGDSGHQTRQYGIVDVSGGSITFTGTQCGAFANGLTGRIGPLVYAIQGNVITGQPVLAKAESALRSTQGDLATRLMAAMEEARRMGGDGRCSCNRGPTGCGSPPANFTHSAYIGFMIVARRGDTDGPCNSSVGCGSGQYYLNFNVLSNGSSRPDPVVVLKQQFTAWEAQQVGKPDHNLSTVTTATRILPNDGRTTASLRITLRDRAGMGITRGGATVKVINDGPAAVQIGTVRDNGDGTYDAIATAGTQVGMAKLRVTVDDGSGVRELAPTVDLRVSADPLWVSRDQLSVAAGGPTEFRLRAGSGKAGRAFVLLGSNSGSTPGIALGAGVNLPLNPGPLFTATVLAAQYGVLPQLLGVLDTQGQASLTINWPAGIYGLPAASKMSFAYAQLFPVDGASNAVDVELVR